MKANSRSRVDIAQFGPDHNRIPSARPVRLDPKCTGDESQSLFGCRNPKCRLCRLRGENANIRFQLTDGVIWPARHLLPMLARLKEIATELWLESPFDYESELVRLQWRHDNPDAARLHDTIELATSALNACSEMLNGIALSRSNAYKWNTGCAKLLQFLKIIEKVTGRWVFTDTATKRIDYLRDRVEFLLKKAQALPQPPLQRAKVC
jgi:hypothetical protein